MLDAELNTCVISISSKNELPRAAAETIKFAAGERVWLFRGEMAAGKTTFIKAICAALGVTDAVSSPTFSLVNEYETARQETVYHFDFYRIQNEQEALDMGILDYLDSGNLCLIEWPVNIKSLLPAAYLLVTLAVGAGEARTITLKRYSDDD